MDELEALRQQIDRQEKQLFWMERALEDYDRFLYRRRPIPQTKISRPHKAVVDPFVLLERVILKGLDALEWLVKNVVDYSVEALSQVFLRASR